MYIHIYLYLNCLISNENTCDKQVPTVKIHKYPPVGVSEFCRLCLEIQFQGKAKLYKCDLFQFILLFPESKVRRIIGAWFIRWICSSPQTELFFYLFANYYSKFFSPINRSEVWVAYTLLDAHPTHPVYAHYLHLV